MRYAMYLLAALLLFSGSAQAKTWDEIEGDGHARRLYLIAYGQAHDLVCASSGLSTKEEEDRIKDIGWWKVLIGIQWYCHKGTPDEVYAAYHSKHRIAGLPRGLQRRKLQTEPQKVELTAVQAVAIPTPHLLKLQQSRWALKAVVPVELFEFDPDNQPTAIDQVRHRWPEKSIPQYVYSP